MEQNLAVLIDFENIATGCEKEGLGRFDIRIVMRRLKDKGRILVARSYADWGRWSRFKQGLVEQGVTMVELTSHGMQDKNRADIALAVDAMELAFTKSFVDTFVILSGDSDFTPLIMRLKELNKRVIGCGTRRSTSRLIVETCDEFFFYDTLRDESRLVPAKKPEEPDDDEEEVLTLDEAFELLVETLENHQRDEAVAVHASIIKASMKRKAPSFNEVELGMRTFAHFLDAAQSKGLVRLLRDEKAGGYRVDAPTTQVEEAPVVREPVRRLSPDAQRLQGILAEGGLEIGEPGERRVIVEQFVATCGERARRNRTCAIQFVLGDLLRRCKQEAPGIAPRTVKAVVHAMRRAGLLIHPNGQPTLATTAPFAAPESSSQLLDDLHAAGLRLLEERGENPDDAVLAELFMGEPEGQEPRTAERKELREDRKERVEPRDRTGRDERRPPDGPRPTGDRGPREPRGNRSRRGRDTVDERFDAPPPPDGWATGDGWVQPVPLEVIDGAPLVEHEAPAEPEAVIEAAPAAKPAPKRRTRKATEPAAVEAPVAVVPVVEAASVPDEDASEGSEGEAPESAEGDAPRRRRRRGGRRGRGGSGESGGTPA